MRTEIRKFLASTEPEVISITGHWGVGKTYAWRRYLVEARDERKIALKHYAYVSLFGLNSLEELKYSIFENTLDVSVINIAPSLATLKSHTDEIGKVLGKRAIGVLQQLPWLKTHIGAIGPAWFLSVRDTIVCVDDIERRGANLSAREVLGLVSFLKEQRNCKIILIWNDDAEDQGPGEFEKYHEKVVDRSLKFEPTPAESTRIALTENSATLGMLAENCMALGISNIRLIKRIERSVRELEKLLSKFDVDVLKQAIHSFTLISWSIYEPARAPSLDFLRRRGSDDTLMNKKALDRRDSVIEEELNSVPILPGSEASWNALLDVYKFSHMDEFDLVLLRGAQNGFFDEPDLAKCGKHMNDRINAERLDSSFAEAWEAYHGSFENDQEQVLDKIYEAFDKAVNRISLTSLNSCVDLFKTLGRPAQAEQMIKTFVERRGQEMSTFDLNHFPFQENITDPDVVHAVNQKFATFVSKRDPKAILISISDTSSWNPTDLNDLATLPVDDYYGLLKNNRGIELRKIINALLKFDNMVGATPTMQEMSKRAKEALKRIGEESPINARRVRRYGVVIDPTSKAAGRS